MELVRIFKEHNVFGWVSVATAILSLFILNLAILSDTISYSYKMLPFAMAAIPLGIIELFIKKGRTGLGLLGVILNLFILICVWTSSRSIRICSLAFKRKIPDLIGDFFMKAPCGTDSSPFCSPSFPHKTGAPSSALFPTKERQCSSRVPLPIFQQSVKAVFHILLSGAFHTLSNRLPKHARPGSKTLSAESLPTLRACHRCRVQKACSFQKPALC